MATRQQFCDAMIKVYENHGVYIGTANGEYTESLTIGQIKQKEIDYGYDREKTNRNIRRDLAYIGKCYESGFDMSRSIAGDCSGIIVGVMRSLGIISATADYRARDFQAKSTPIALANLQYADLVFDKKKEATHVGTYVGDGMVVESKGRDAGVVYRKVSEGGWVVGGRLDWFEDSTVTVLNRVLKYVADNMMRGDDVKAVQEELNRRKFNCGTADGVFGKNTDIAVRNFQTDAGLTVDGKVGKNTALALGFAWEG